MVNRLDLSIKDYVTPEEIVGYKGFTLEEAKDLKEVSLIRKIKETNGEIMFNRRDIVAYAEWDQNYFKREGLM